ncbi:MAG: accessory factor UbiK family protein [Alphaproteobacteria bacterium]
MGPQSRLLDDLARIAGGAAGALAGVKSEVEAVFRQQAERLLSGMELVSREEFEVVREMIVEARTRQEELSRRLDEMERLLAERGP